ncbi:MAG: ABC transporter substrate-binding protein [Acidimicrobiales bacterium]|nr:ABC transporter substrate-binding protein [Acidimicrobiales bacterium]
MRALVAVGAALVVASGLAACGGSTSPTEDAASTAVDVTIAPSGPPRPGGSITYALEAESDGFNPTSSRWAVSGYTVAGAVFDPLAAYDESGVARPYLAESFTPSSDFLTWTVAVRPDVRFHNGEVLDGAAVKKSLDAAIASPLVGASLANVAGITVDPARPLELVVTMREPWAVFPSVLTGQPGYIAAPAQLDAPAPDNTRVPIGTGPFVVESWTPDKSWTGTRNPDYWRRDADGTQLPYLDAVEFVPVTDAASRTAALLNGDVQLAHTYDWPAIRELRAAADEGRVQLVVDVGPGEEGFVIFNTARPPLDDVRVRRPLAQCTNRDEFLAVSQVPPEQAATSQFAPSSPWFEPDAGFPAFDQAAGSAAITELEAEKGPLRVELNSVPAPETQTQIQVIATQWEACGVDVDLKATEQSAFIADMVSGNYSANLSRQFGATDPDGDYVWWIGRNAAPIGSFALNFARLADARVDDALDRGRATDDVEARTRAYADLQRRQSELVPYVWLSHIQWVVGGANDVRNIGNQTLPDGEPARTISNGNVRLTETWLER